MNKGKITFKLTKGSVSTKTELKNINLTGFLTLLKALVVVQQQLIEQLSKEKEANNEDV